MARLTIYKKGTESTVRCEVEKWEFHDKAMGEQYITFDISFHIPIDFEIGDWCMFRGQKYTLNIQPTCTQKARPNTYGGAFEYESVKLYSEQDKLTRCIILDIIPTSGEHSAAYGTNYTGSANFTLNCFETTFTYQGNVITYAPVHALLDRIKANLDRLYPNDHWQFYLDDDKCKSDDKIITFSNWTAVQALAEIHNTFKLDYTVKGTNIVVGDVSELEDLPQELIGINGYVTDLDNQGVPLFFGYGMGYLTDQNQSKSLFQIKKISKSDQLVVTRLRAMGSTKNMPYRYYHNNYTLPQTMYVQNLQLPDTFVPYDRDEDYPDNVDAPHCKVDGNAERDRVYGEGVLRHVLGKSNDAYIDKGDDAESCPEGIREGTARWDGSDGELPEIYPTIEEATYEELRANNVADMDGRKGSSAFPHYDNKERIDTILGIDSSTCNVGTGTMTENEAIGRTEEVVPVNLFSRSVAVEPGNQSGYLFNIEKKQEPGNYILSYTTQAPQVFLEVNAGDQKDKNFLLQFAFVTHIYIKQRPSDGSSSSIIATYENVYGVVYGSGSYREQNLGNKFELTLPDFHNVLTGWDTQNLTVTKQSTIEVSILLTIADGISKQGSGINWNHFNVSMGVRNSDATQGVEPKAIWQVSDAAQHYSDTPFTIMLKDFGVNFLSLDSVDGSDIILSMKSGQCAGREFTVKKGSISEYEQIGTHKWGYKLELERAVDESIHAYFPSQNNTILPGDQFVLLNIALPDAYIKAAEVRLLKAATEHLADNCETQYTYQPSVDDIYLQRNIDFNEQAGTPEQSVFWRLYAGMRFPFYGIPASENDPLPMADITIDQVTIKMGEKLTPQVEITLNDKLQQNTISKIQTTVDRIYGSVFSSNGVSYATTDAMMEKLINTIGSKYFLSKLEDDSANGKITFLGGLDVQSLAEIAQAYISGSIGSYSYQNGFSGDGWKIDSSNNSMVLDELTVRKTMRVFELLIQQVRSSGGEIIVTPANGRIKSVSYVPAEGGVEAYYYVTLESGDAGPSISSSFGNMFKVGDYVRCQRWDQQLNTTRYYWAKVTWVGGDHISLPQRYFFDEELGGYVQPSDGDEIVLLGSTDTNRQGAITISAAEDGCPRITILDGITAAKAEAGTLAGCTRVVLGDLNGITDEYMGALEGYGLYSDNVYLRGKLTIQDGDSFTEIGAGFLNLRDGVNNAGIDIENGEITLTAGKTTFNNPSGGQIASFTDEGFQSNVVQCLDEDGNVRVKLDKDGLKMYYANGQTLKEEYFVFDSEGGVSGAETRYYNKEGVLQWTINTLGELDRGEVESYWSKIASYYVTTEDISTIVTGVAQGKRLRYPWSQTANAITNVTAAEFRTTDQYSSYNGMWTIDNVSHNPNASSVTPLEGWLMSPIIAIKDGNNYTRNFYYYSNGRKSSTNVPYKPTPTTTAVLTSVSVIIFTFNLTNYAVTAYSTSEPTPNFD